MFDLSSIHTFASDHAKGGIIVGSVSYTAAQANDLFSGLHYINIYTDANLGGEIRGQLVVVPEPRIVLLIMLGFFGMSGWFRFRR